MKKNSSTGRHARECLFPVGNPGASAPRQRPAIVPFFLPFAGCPHRCLFCAQDKQTGHTRPSDCLPYPQALANLLSELETHHMERTASRPIELAFYGGTFTALPERLQTECLALAMQAKEKGIVCRVRCSTRPDALRPDRLQALRHAGLDLVELGIQSFHTEALLDVQRGYNGDRAREGCRLIKESGLKLGIQLLPGMPGSTPQRFSEDVEEALAFSPSCLRFYPCLVVDGTPLADRTHLPPKTHYHSKRGLPVPKYTLYLSIVQEDCTPTAGEYDPFLLILEIVGYSFSRMASARAAISCIS